MLDFATLRRPDTPNTYLVCPEGLCRSAEPDRVSPVFEVSPEFLRDMWLETVSRQPRTVTVERDDPALAYEFVQRSLIFRFPDQISVRILEFPGARSTIAIYSRSTVGRYDFGVNRQRVESWLKILAKLTPLGRMGL